MNRGNSRAGADSVMRDETGSVMSIQVNEPPISLGSSQLSDYTKLSVLGKGTYGEVHKCVHNPTGIIVAMKTYIFEVSDPTLLETHLFLECDQWNQLQYNARN
jgi:serine/threonine protein kinase